ncbi:MAG: hypothetical protein RIR11_675 [Bacteroidota bacterium]|jgi:hypothetical protein
MVNCYESLFILLFQEKTTNPTPFVILTLYLPYIFQFNILRYETTIPYDAPFLLFNVALVAQWPRFGHL